MTNTKAYRYRLSGDGIDLTRCIHKDVKLTFFVE